jgi:exopolysaccharide biosynthesis WecB/TagA/CpsF family protein
MNARHQVFGVAVDSVDQDGAIDAILARAHDDRPGYVVTPNLDHVMKLRSDTAFRDAYRDASLILPDGHPLLWMARLRGKQLHLVTGSDLVVPLCHAASREACSVFLFGTTFEAVTTCARKLYANDNALDIAGVYSPPSGFENDPAQRAQAVDAIKAAAPDVLFVALGAPRQEIWAHHNVTELGCQIVCVGAGLDFVAGTQRRAPLPFRKAGFEWLWRAVTQPRRLALRYVTILCWLPILVVLDLLDAMRRRR